MDTGSQAPTERRTPDCQEACSGLMWMGSSAALWSCVADAHVYNVRLGPPEGAQIQRAGLTWLKFRDAPDAARAIYIQIQQGRSAFNITRLEIDGRRCEVVAAD